MPVHLTPRVDIYLSYTCTGRFYTFSKTGRVALVHTFDCWQ